MPRTRADWDEKHWNAGEASAIEASPLARELLPLLPTGPALDLACGRGRHTLLLAERGQAVTAVDWSPAALDLLERAAAAKGLKVHHGNHGHGGNDDIRPAAKGCGIFSVCADLEKITLPSRVFALVLCIQYLDRRLMPEIERALQPGGAVLFETYTTAQLAFEGGLRNPDYLLRPGELRRSFPGLETIFYRELNAGQGIASILARKPVESNEGRPRMLKC